MKGKSKSGKGTVIPRYKYLQHLTEDEARILFKFVGNRYHWRRDDLISFVICQILRDGSIKARQDRRRWDRSILEEGWAPWTTCIDCEALTVFCAPEGQLSDVGR